MLLHLPRQPANQQALRCRAYWCLSTLILLFAAAPLVPAGDRGEPHHITALRFWSLGDVTRIAIESDGDFSLRSDRLENPERLFFDLVGAKPTLGSKGMTVILIWTIPIG